MAKPTFSFANNETVGVPVPVICYLGNITSSGIYNGDYPLDFSLPLLLVQVCLVIIVTNIVRFILRPLNQPTFVCNVIGGILVGPSGLGRYKTFSDTVFPQRSFSVMKMGSVIGTIYYFFIIGVKQDPKVILNTRRKSWVIASVGAIIPLTLISSIFILAVLMTHKVEQINFIVMLVASLSLSAFPSLHPILSELNLLNSKLGQLAITASTNNNVAGLLVVFINGVMKNVSDPYKALYYIVSMVALVSIIFCIIRPMMFWIIHRTPQGRPVDRSYIIAILLGVLVTAFICDLIGSTMTIGALLFGLAMPDGPPLGAALVEKSETIVQSFFLPLMYATIGLKTDVFSIDDWISWRNLQSILILGYMAKVVGIILPARYFKMPFYDALSLALIMNFKGLLEIIVFVKINEHKMMNDASYTTLVLSTVAVMAISTPLVRWFSQCSKLYTPYGLRTIEHSEPNAELRIVTCILTKENLPAMINLLEASHATRESPLLVWNLNLVELVGRAVPMFISHSLQQNSSSSTMPHIKQINNAFQKYEARNRRWISIHSFTSVSPYTTMHHDICMLALDKKASLIIMPFHKYQANSLRILTSNVLDEAPCSVGILVDNGHQINSFKRNSWYHICVIFLGGADDREALSYGFHMEGHPHIRLDVVRILLQDDNVVNEREKQLDDRLIELFRVKSAGNGSVAYREEMVNTSAATISVIRSMANLYNLMVVGRRQESNSLLIEGLSQWCVNPELGVIGDFLASSDFSNGIVSVLVLQQQINVGIVVFNGPDLHVSQI